MTVHPLLRELDERQRDVVTTPHGPLCVRAGAGTGKTRAISHRIAYGVATGAYAPERVMALAFTKKAASELHERVQGLGAGGVSVRTFHSAALAQLSFFWPRYFGGHFPAVLASKGRLVAEAMESLRYERDTTVLRDVAAEIEWRKVSGLSLDEYERVVEQRARHISAEKLIAVHRKYEELKDARRKIDFEDVLLATAGLIENEPAAAMRVHEQYRVFLVDEFQDVSPLQHHLLTLWLGQRRDVCVVGDVQQTIYSFAGARSDYLVDFPRTFSDARVVTLDRNYRSSPQILAVANRLMRDRPDVVALQATRGSTEYARRHPLVTAYESDAAEATAIAEKIRQGIDAGRLPADIAVLFRIRAQGALFERALGDAGISYRTHGSPPFFDVPEVRQALMAIRAAAVAGLSDSPMKAVSDILRSLGWSADPPSDPGAARDRWESLNALATMVDAFPPSATLREVSDDLSARQHAGHEPPSAAVTLATLHSAKGLEWDAVYLAGLSEGLLPIVYASESHHIDEERRLLYVGVTRAKEELHLSWAHHSVSGLVRRVTPRTRSRFLQEIGSHMMGEAGTPRE